MTAALTAELIKVFTTKLWWILLICVLLLGGGYATLPAITAILTEPTAAVAAFEDAATLRAVYNGGNTLSRILALVIGLMSMGGEYRHRTIVATYLAVPHRLRAVAAKAVALTLFGLLYGLVNLLAGVVVAVPFVLVRGGSFFLDQPETWRSMALGVVSIALWTMIGFGFGILIKNMIVAMLVGIGFAYLLEPTLTVLFFAQQWDLPLNLMPSGATNAMLGITSPILFASSDPFPWWGGFLVLAGWCLVPAVLGVLITLRRDV